MFLRMLPPTTLHVMFTATIRYVYAYLTWRTVSIVYPAVTIYESFLKVLYISGTSGNSNPPSPSSSLHPHLLQLHLLQLHLLHACSLRLTNNERRFRSTLFLRKGLRGRYVFAKQNDVYARLRCFQERLRTDRTYRLRRRRESSRHGTWNIQRRRPVPLLLYARCCLCLCSLLWRKA